MKRRRRAPAPAADRGRPAAPAPAAAPPPPPVAPAGRAVTLLLGALVVLSLAGRLAWLDRPRGLMFDEVYYVNAARVILDLPRPADDPWAHHPRGLDPNVEHTPGGKVLIAASIKLLGDNPWGWRLPSALLGTLAILLLYGLARRVGAPPGAALLAAFAFAFDDLAFVHARVGTLDAMQLGFMLLGLWAYAGRRPVVAGLGLAAGALCKITGLYGIGAVLALEAVRRWRARRATGRWDGRPIGRAALAAGVFVAAFLAGLGALDHFVGVFTSPTEHLRYVLAYGYTLQTTGGSVAAVSQPWEWLVNRAPMLYHAAGPAVHAAMNPAVVFATVPAVGYCAWRAARRQADPAAEPAGLVVALFAATYLPTFLGAAAGRIAYIYYFLPVVPAVALGAALLVEAGRARLRILPWLYAAAVLAGFVWRFPYRSWP
jgi:predicted membrane-bound dolichyl-phosphate-mannose-protein mannosyltransferase